MRYWKSLSNHTAYNPDQTGHVVDTEGRYLVTTSNNSQGVRLEDFERSEA